MKNVFHVVSALQSIVCLYTFLGLIRSFVDPTLVAFIVCGPLQFLVSQLYISSSQKKEEEEEEEVSTGKTGLPFQEFRLFQKISSGTNQKVVFHLHPNRNFRNF